MAQDPDEPQKSCFVICPFGEDNTEKRAWSDDILESFIRPIVAEFGYNANRSLDTRRAGEITTTMIEDIIESHLVIADLTTLNPNVFYELAVRHIQGKPYIHIAKHGTTLPFDVSHTNTVFINLESFASVEKSKNELRGQLRSIDEGRASFDNPVKRYHQKLKAIETGDPMEKRLIELEEKLSMLMRRGADDMNVTNVGARIVSAHRFADLNDRIRSHADADMRSVLLRNRFRFVFNPESGKWKSMTFLPDGTIGEGRHPNENTWRINNGRLELVEQSGDVHSRFVYDKDNVKFNHTGEADLKSVTGQSLVIAPSGK